MGCGGRQSPARRGGLALIGAAIAASCCISSCGNVSGDVLRGSEVPGHGAARCGRPGRDRGAAGGSGATSSSGRNVSGSSATSHGGQHHEGVVWPARRGGGRTNQGHWPRSPDRRRDQGDT
eukprot:6804588-Pyramimonas_sp.AAC.1